MSEAICDYADEFNEYRSFKSATVTFQQNFCFAIMEDAFIRSYLLTRKVLVRVSLKSDMFVDQNFQKLSGLQKKTCSKCV